MMSWFRAVGLYRAVLIAGCLGMLAANMPGHLSYDSVTQLHEGRFHVRDTWAPAVYSAILGAFDRLVPGAGLYLCASAVLAFGTFLALRNLRPTMSWAAPATAAAVVLTPAMMIFQGDVWKDVLFANLAIAAFVLLAHLAKDWTTATRRPWIALIMLVLLLALAAQVRQNGLIAAIIACATLAWTARGAGLKAALAWGLGGLAAVLVTSQTLGVLALPPGAAHDDATGQGVRILQSYDIVGGMAHDKSMRLDDFRAAVPGVEEMIRIRGVPLYTPERIDYLSLDPAFSANLKQLPLDVTSTQWRHMILRYPGAYLAHRWAAFSWVFLTPKIDSCLPLYVGVDGAPAKLAELQIPAQIDRLDQRLYNYGTFFLDTPVQSHLTYALICALTAILLLLRRDPQDFAIIGLMVAALGFTASFLIISVACDYRYLYFLDLAALIGLTYLAIDPPFTRRGRSAKP